MQLRSSFVWPGLFAFTLLCSADEGWAGSVINPVADARSARSGQVLKNDLQQLLRRVSFNIVRMERGFTISVFRERMKFEHLEPLGDEDKRYRISSPRVNGILELKLGSDHFTDLVFWEAATESPLSGRVIRIDELRLRRR